MLTDCASLIFKFIFLRYNKLWFVLQISVQIIANIWRWVLIMANEKFILIDGSSMLVTNYYGNLPKALLFRRPGTRVLLLVLGEDSSADSRGPSFSGLACS